MVEDADLNAEAMADLIGRLRSCIDELLPGAKHLVVDFGKLNATLIEARKVQERLLAEKYREMDPSGNWLKN